MYTITTQKSLVSATAVNNVLILHDEINWNVSEKDAKDRHFKNIHALFMSRIERLGKTTQGLSKYEENELQYMFEALLESKQAQESERS